MIKKTLYFGNPAYLSLRNKQLVIKMPQWRNLKMLQTSFEQNQSQQNPLKI